MFYKFPKLAVLAVLVTGLLIGGSAKIDSARAAGASLFFTPASGNFTVGDSFTVAVRAFVGGNNINASEGLIGYDKNLLEVVGVSDSGSIFTLWTTEPGFSKSKGTISYGGGVQPPGFSGQTGKIISVAFRAKAAGTAQVRFSSGAILANDGKGSNILESMGGASFNIKPRDAAAAASNTAASLAAAKKPAAVVPMAQLEGQETGDAYLKPMLTSNTHPDQNTWSNKNTVQIKWVLPAGVTKVAGAFNREFNYDPAKNEIGLVTEKTYNNVTDGVWFMHVKFYDGKKWSAGARYRVLIDANRPTPFQIQVKQSDPNALPKLFFKSADGLSGVDRYEVYVNSFEERQFDLTEDEAEEAMNVQLSNLEYGEHMAMIRVIDKAGNETISTAQFKVQPIETPVIKNYAKEIRSGDQFFISGTSLPNTKVNLYIQSDNKIIASRLVESDQNGNWFYMGNENLVDGRYVAWIEAENEFGLKSMPTEKISFLVSPPIFAVIGTVVVNYFTVFASLIFVIVMILIGGLYLTSILRKRLRKETVEVEVVLNDKLDELQRVVDKEVMKFNRLSKDPAIAKEGKKMRQNMNSHIETTRKKIMSEIKDVEDILK